MIRTIDFNALSTGDTVTDQFGSLGVKISAVAVGRGVDKAMIFDTAAPTGGDADLATDNLGKVLVISEDGDAADPDDNASGGTFAFDFAAGVTVKSLTFLDIEETARLRFLDAEGNLLSEQFVPATGDNGQRVVELAVPDTARMEVTLKGSGAIDNLVFDDMQPLVADDSDEGADPTGDGIVSGDETGNTVDLAYTGDPQGDRVDAGDALIAGEAPDDDIIDALGGDDTVTALAGDDDIYAGAGDDVVAGGAGDDLIYGDRTLAEASAPDRVEPTRESFNWSDAGLADGAPVTSFTQDTGTVEVTFTTLSATPKTATVFSGEVQRTEGIDGGAERVSTTSSLGSETGGNAQSIRYALDFAAPVSSVDFNINDIDGDSTVTVLAFDAAGEPLPVMLLGGAGLTVTGNSATGDGDYADAFDPFYSLEVDIAGPVARIEIVHEQTGPGGTGMNITDVFFTAGGVAGPAGDDMLSGDEGDDTIFGEAGDDTISGGAGADSLSGGDGADTFMGGTAGDAVDGGAGGDDRDTLDLTDTGPFRIVGETRDADGDSTSGTIEFLDEDGVVTGTMSFTEIETILGRPADPLGPVAVDDSAITAENTAVIVDLRSNDTDPDTAVEALTISAVSVPVIEGSVVDNGDGTVTFTPADGFTGTATLTYTVTDPTGLSDTGEAVVTVTPVEGNQPPVATGDQAVTDQDAPVVIDVLGNDSDPDGDPLSVSAASSPEGAVAINADGTLTFTPAPGFNGPTEISYTLSDGNGGEAPGTVSVTVRDGIVTGTDGDDFIDPGFTGDPEGDLVDNGDAFLPGEGPQDDIIEAGAGDDTVLAGAGDDEVAGGDGNDSIDGGLGDDVIDSGGTAPLPDIGYPGVFPADGDPEDDRDRVDGGAGNDTIRTGDDRDTVTGGDGADVIDAGIDDDIVDGGSGDDRIVGGEGSDTLQGGAGNDTIYANNDPALGLDAFEIEDDGSNPLGPDLAPDNGDDLVNGGGGDDVIFGGDDDDTLRGGSGDDFLDGGIDDDLLQGGTGADTLLGGQGDDSLSGGQDDDLLDGGIGGDTLRGNRGDDTLQGGAGDDLLDGGADDDLLSGDAGDDTLQGALGADTLQGGTGDDALLGGSGDDVLLGGAGNDTMTGGNDRDVFRDVNAGDVVDGSEGGDDFDTLELAGSAPEGGRLEVTFDPTNPENGVVDYINADGSDAGQLVFTNIERVVPCFTPGTLIATPQGERKVEELAVGDRIITRDNGMQAIRWIGRREMPGEELAAKEHLRPVLIRQGALGNGLPERDMLVSPQHRLLVANDRTALYFEEREVLVAAKHLTDMEGIDSVEVSHTSYIHIMFDQHEVILSDGTWSESFQPGDMSLAGVGDASRDEILELFPELATRAGIEGYASARKSLKKHEARLITLKS